MNRYFSSFQKSRGGDDPPQKNSRGGHVPPGIAANVCGTYMLACISNEVTQEIM